MDQNVDNMISSDLKLVPLIIEGKAKIPNDSEWCKGPYFFNIFPIVNGRIFYNGGKIVKIERNIQRMAVNNSNGDCQYKDLNLTGSNSAQDIGLMAS